MAPMAAALDCKQCGACCVNPPDNVAEGFSDYVEIGPRDALASKPEMLRRYAKEESGRLHMRILSDQRCKALLGRIGHNTRCGIYQLRPSPCRRVEAGSELCQRYRRGQGLA
jgi:Fe-S-cluster containining protein